ncbi:MAG: metabolite traffic protein EboE [Synechococcus sp.]
MKLAQFSPQPHLTYCTNIHPGETWAEVFQNLQTHLVPLKRHLCPAAPFGVGLRLAEVAAQELVQGDRLRNLRRWLDTENLYVFTLNGFPYGGFHHQVVKDRVYAPDWTQPERADYTLKLVKILAALLPEGMEGGISTVPLSYKPWWATAEEAHTVFRSSSLQLARVVAELVSLQQDSGIEIHIDLEPEPNGGIENAAETIEFFHSWLLPVGGQWLAQHLGCDRQQAESLLLKHIAVCYDTCHFAVEYEDPTDAIARLQAAGIRVGKVQISSALRVPLPTERSSRQAVANRLQPFAESTYLHQVIARQQDGQLSRYSDLTEALPELVSSEAQEWRIHFHVPIFLQDYQLLQSTQNHISGTLTLLGNTLKCQHLEIETYTWDVLPPELKLDIQDSIRREYEWVLWELRSLHPDALSSLVV